MTIRGTPQRYRQAKLGAAAAEVCKPGGCRFPVGAQGGLSPPGELRRSPSTSHAYSAFLPTCGFPCVSLCEPPTRACPPPKLPEYRLRPGCSAMLGRTFLLELAVPDSLVRLPSQHPCPPGLRTAPAGGLFSALLVISESLLCSPTPPLDLHHSATLPAP